MLGKIIFHKKLYTQDTIWSNLTKSVVVQKNHPHSTGTQSPPLHFPDDLLILNRFILCSIYANTSKSRAVFPDAEADSTWRH